MAKKEDLAELIFTGINSLDKSMQIAYRLGEEVAPADMNDFISTGCTPLDMIVSNREDDGGIAYGRITEISGQEGSGKSLLVATMMKNVQQDGGLAVFLDTENAINDEFCESIGLNTKDKDSFIYGQPKSIEQVFQVIDSIIETVQKKGKDKKVIIVVDSIAGVSTNFELEKEGYEKQGYGAGKATVLNEALRKYPLLLGKLKIALVFTNQLRQKFNAAPFSDPWDTPGGKALPFAASTRIRLAYVAKIKNDGIIVGIKVKATVTKNRLTSPFRSTEFDLYFDRGIDDLQSWVDILKKKELIYGTAKEYTFESLDGTKHTFSAKGWQDFITEHPEVYAEIRHRLFEVLQMKYSSEGITTDDGAEVEAEEE